MLLTTIGTCIWSTDGGSMIASRSNSKDATISKTWKNVWCATKIKTQLQSHALALVGLSFHLVIESISILNTWALLFQQGKQLIIPNTLIGLLYFLLLASNETRNGSSAPSWTQIQLPIRHQMTMKGILQILVQIMTELTKFSFRWTVTVTKHHSHFKGNMVIWGP